MNEAVAWSVMKWLREKKRVRNVADEANAALDGLAQAVQQRWPESIRVAYATLGSESARPKPAPAGGKKLSSQAVDAEALLVAKKMKESDDEAYRARMDAEATFDDAERKLSTSLAREGCRKAILSWDLKEKAIRKAESAIGHR